jgi:hypothetical protein
MITELKEKTELILHPLILGYADSDVRRFSTLMIVALECVVDKAIIPGWNKAFPHWCIATLAFRVRHSCYLSSLRTLSNKKERGLLPSLITSSPQCLTKNGHTQVS